jgi:homoserine dehydrogenase
MGGTTLAKELIVTAIKNGKHVITANLDSLPRH